MSRNYAGWEQLTEESLAAWLARPKHAVTAPGTQRSETCLTTLKAHRDARLPDTTTEEELLARVRQLAKMAGWQTYHTYSSQRSEPGFPDLVLCNGEDVLMIELKDNRRKPTTEQETWLNLLQHTGKVEASLWRPRDWPAIVERLTRKRGPHGDT